MESIERVVPEKHKVYLHRGDVVKFKGMTDGGNVEMKVKGIAWEKNEDGSIKRVNNKRIPIGVLVGWTNERGDYIEKVFDTRSLYKVELTGQYHLVEAKKFFIQQGMTDVVELINVVLDKCN